MFNIQNNFFNYNADSYDYTAKTQKLSASFLASKLYTYLLSEDFHPHSLLDIGAGTGYAALAVNNYFTALDITLNDLSTNMLNIAQKKFNKANIKTIAASFDHYDFDDYDLIIANFSLQWSQSIFSTVEKLYNSSKYFCFSTLVTGSFKEIDNKLSTLGINSKFDNYLAKDDYLKKIDTFAKHKVITFEQSFPISFSKLRLFFTYIKNIGAIHQKFSLDIASKRKLIYYLQTNDITPIDSHYKVLYVIMKR